MKVWNIRSRGRRRAPMAVLLALIAGCTFGDATTEERFAGPAESLIEGDLAGQIGFGPLDASCELPGAGQPLGAGDSFPCTAMDGEGREVAFLATIEPGEEGVVVQSTNLLLAGQVDAIEAAAAQQVSVETGVAVEPADLDCGTTSILAVDGDTLPCRVRDPGDGTFYEAPVVLHSIEGMVIDVTVGDPIG